jgi:hypothetical protein
MYFGSVTKVRQPEISCSTVRVLLQVKGALDAANGYFPNNAALLNRNPSKQKVSAAATLCRESLGNNN